MVKGPHLRTLGILRILRAAADILAVVSGKPHLNLKSARFTQIDHYKCQTHMSAKASMAQKLDDTNSAVV